MLAQVVATITRIPDMIVLLAAGALIGPSVLGLVANPLDGVGAQLLFNIGVAMILFHGGVGISLRVISRTAVGLGLLVSPGVLLTAFIVALVVSPAFGVAFPVALVVGAVLASTDPAIIIPLFERLKIRPKVSQTVVAESAFNDVTGTVFDPGPGRGAGVRAVHPLRSGLGVHQGARARRWDRDRGGGAPVFRGLLGGTVRDLGRIARRGDPRGRGPRLRLGRSSWEAQPTSPPS